MFELSATQYRLADLLLTFLGFLGMIISLAFVYSQLGHARRAREVDLLVKLHETTGSDPLFSDFEKVLRLEGKCPECPEMYASCMRTSIFLEMVGIIVSRRNVDTSLVEEYFGVLIERTYDATRGFIRDQRRTIGGADFAKHFEKLALSLKGLELTK